jgi:hypothetical protein
VIEQKESVRRHKRPGLPHLLHDPERIRISGYVETQNLSPVMAYDKEAIHQANVSVGTVKKSMAAMASRW